MINNYYYFLYFEEIVPLENKIEVKEQVLIPQTRKGYTVVEWGGNIHN